MACFDDLSVCSYFPHSWLPVLLAVGWLERGHPYTTGNPGRAVCGRLDEFRRGRWQPFHAMGGHVCDLCAHGLRRHPSLRDETYSYRNLFIPGASVTYV